MNGYPRYFLPLLWAVLGGLLLSGLLLIPGALELRLEWDMPVRLPAGWRIGTGAVHALFAFAVLFAVGMLAPMHVRSGWRRGANRGSGTLLLSALVLLSMSALGIYYLAGDGLSAAVSLLHTTAGLGVAVPLLLHVRAARLLRRRKRRTTGAPAQDGAPRVKGRGDPAPRPTLH